MRKLPIAFIGLLLFAIVIVGGGALAQIVPYGSQLIVGPTSSPLVLQLTGTQNSCYFHEEQASGFVPGPVDVWGSNDGVNFLTPLQIYDTANALHSQPYTPTNKVEYSISPVGFAYLGIFPDSTWNAGTQQATTKGRCSSSIARAAPASPFPSPSPTASSAGCGALSWSGSFPYQINGNFTGCVSSSSLVTPAPHTTPNYVATILATSGLQDFWELNDNPNGCSSSCTPGPCPSTMADSGPSNIPLQTPTPSASPPNCGATGIIKDGGTSAEFDWVSGSQQYYMVIPSHQIATLCNANAGGLCNHSFTIECIMEWSNSAVLGSAGQVWFLGDASNETNFTMGANPNFEIWVQGGGDQWGNNVPAGVPLDLVFEYDNSITHSEYFLNGVLAWSVSIQPKVTASVNSYLGMDTFGKGYDGRLEYCSTYNVALSAATVRSHFLSTALP